MMDEWFRSLEAGSWTALVTGVGSILVAVVLGSLAVHEASKANRWHSKAVFWAKEAATATKRANQLAESANALARAALDIDFQVSWFQLGGRPWTGEDPATADPLVCDTSGDIPRVRCFTHITVTNTGSTVWFVSAAATIDDFIDLDRAPGEDEVPWYAPKSFNSDRIQSPKRLHRGESVQFPAPQRLNLNYAHRIDAVMTIEYATEEGGPTTSLERPISFPDMQPGTAPGLWFDEDSGVLWESGELVEDDDARFWGDSGPDWDEFQQQEPRPDE